MLRASFFIKAIAALTVVYTFCYISSQRSFEHFLDTLNITFSDFPPSYALALNTSITHNEPITDFNYTTAFPPHPSHIPRIIHYIWFKNLYPISPTTIPSQGSHSPRLCREHNPNYEIRVWDATTALQFLEHEYPWFLPTYNSYPYPIQKIDALKYFALYHYGGVYIDLDIACRRPLDPLLGFPAWFPEAEPLGVNNDLMACRARHPVLKRMTERLVAYDSNWLFPYVTIFKSTGPRFTTDILEEWWEVLGKPQALYSARKEEAGLDAFFILPRIFYSEEYTFFGHSPGGTWHGSDVATVLWFVQHPGTTLSIFALLGVALAAVVCRRRGRQRGASYTRLGHHARSSRESQSMCE